MHGGHLPSAARLPARGAVVQRWWVFLNFPRLPSISLHGVVFPADVLLSPSKWHQMHWSGDKATLTLTHLNKEDEGLYTLRVTTKSGYETYSAYVFVRGEQPGTAHIKYGKWTAPM